MSTDIERLLAAAADDTDRPLSTDVDDLLVRARRSVRKTRIATVSTAVLTTGAIIAGVTTWSANRTDGNGPVGTPTPGVTLTIDVKTGQILDDETGKPVLAPPPVSNLSDAELRDRCKPGDQEFRDAAQEHGGNDPDKAGTLAADWKVMVKSGTGDSAQATFLSPDGSIAATCMLSGVSLVQAYGRFPTKAITGQVPSEASLNAPRVPADVSRVVVNLEGGGEARQALVGADGFYSLGDLPLPSRIQRIRGYDAAGHKTYDVTIPTPETARVQPTVPSNVTLKTAAPVIPDAVLTKDPLTGKALVPAPPASPLTDDQVRTRCRGVDDIYMQNPSGDPRITAAGPLTKDWKVALKTGTGDKLTAVLISPDRKVFAWCHMLGATAKGPYDYTRGAVQANGKFADSFDFGMVPDGVAQLVVDLPKQGPTRALVSNGFYIWGLTGGNSDLQNVRVRGYDAHGKQIYTATKQIDADFD
ncbi:MULTISPECIES: hypothetical protein [Kribbella]|uniref:Uncharacterized protein n=1 Tax=Kribbella karoonensis TaxID=324851 RepID=A0ABN2E5H6_9ACTN